MASNRGIAWQRMSGRPHRSKANTTVAKRNAQMVESFKRRRMEAANRLMEIRARRALLADAQLAAYVAQAQAAQSAQAVAPAPTDPAAEDAPATSDALEPTATSAAAHTGHGFTVGSVAAQG